MHDYGNSVNSSPPKTITPRQIINPLGFGNDDLIDDHVANRPTDDVERLLRALRVAAIDGEFLVEIGEVAQ